MVDFRIKKPKYRFWVNPRSYAWAVHIRSRYGRFSKKKVNNRRRRDEYFRRKRFTRGKIRLNLRQKKNNFFSTLYTIARRVIWTLSCGIIGLRGPRRSTLFGAQQLGRFSTKNMVRVKAYKAFLVLKSAYNSHMRGCIKNIGPSVRIRALVDLIPRPHNGLRARKLRRL